ncbi:MAG TPA: NACHT domain-containing protein [Candidatus Limnocylindrales bacterium]|nr:NACHT domain-containing protein [Candidatus Limnocylindrales bacterium]
MAATAGYSWPDHEVIAPLPPPAPGVVPLESPREAKKKAAKNLVSRFPRAEVVGRMLEDGLFVVLRRLFAMQDATGATTLTRLRKQNAGTQYGYDLALEVHDAVHGTVRYHFECKNHQRPITLDDIAGKLLMNEQQWRETHIDHFIVVSPHRNAANDLDVLLKGWNENRKYPFDVSVWGPEDGIRDLFRLVPQAYGGIYDEAVPHLDPDEAVKIGERWRERLRPVVRLSRNWIQYLRTPTDHDLSGEDAAYLEQIRANAVTLHAAEESGSPLPGTLDSNVRDWLTDQSPQSLLLLAEFGEGKSFFCYQFAVQLAQQFLANPSAGWIPLSLPLRAFRQETSMSRLLDSRLAAIGIDRPDWRRVSTGEYRTLVILDGFDEMSTRLDPQAVAANLRALQEGFELFPTSKLLITSRTHFFEHINDRRRFLDHAGHPRIVRIAPVPYQLRLAHLEAYAAGAGAGAQLAKLKRLHDPIGLAAKPLFLRADFQDADLTGVQLEQTAPVLALAIDGDTVIAAYGDQTVRRWSTAAGGRNGDKVIAQLDFRPQSLALSPFGDVIVAGDQQVAVLSPVAAEQSWPAVSLFQARPDLRGISVAQQIVAVHRATGDGTFLLHTYEPPGRGVLATVPTPGSGAARLLSSQVACTHTKQAGLTLYLGLGGPEPEIHHLATPHLASLDGRLLDDRTVVFLFGHDSGDISLWKATIDGPRSQLTELWCIAAHSAPATAVVLSDGLLASGGIDRVVNRFTMVDQTQATEPVRLHRDFRCESMLIDGVRGVREHELLLALIQ